MIFFLFISLGLLLAVMGLYYTLGLDQGKRGGGDELDEE